MPAPTIRWSYRQTIAQTITDGNTAYHASSKLLFDVVEYNSHPAAWAASVFASPVAGLAIITGRVHFVDQASDWGNDCFVHIVKNGVVQVFARDFQTNNATTKGFAVGATVSLPVAIGDQFYVAATLDGETQATRVDALLYQSRFAGIILPE